MDSLTNRCVLVLDEVWDPQNFGALLRTSYFLKCDKVVVCAKNSAPLSAVVSKASAGAMEVMSVYSTDNLMKFLDKSKDNGWQVSVFNATCGVFIKWIFVIFVLGSSIPLQSKPVNFRAVVFFHAFSQVVGTDLSPKSISLYDVPRTAPTILVLGNEGHGIRTNILRRCTHLVRLGTTTTTTTTATSGATTSSQDAVSSGSAAGLESNMDNIVTLNGESNVGGEEYAIEHGIEDSESVDSLNVSVTGAIILHHFMSQMK